jgi:hypothetical protein
MIATILALGFLTLIVTGYFLVRLNWVKQFQTVILMRSPGVYMHLPNWRVMMFHKFWIWEDTYFLPDPDSLRRE